MTRSTRSLRSLLLVIPVIATLLATGAAVGSNAQAVLILAVSAAPALDDRGSQPVLSRL